MGYVRSDETFEATWTYDVACTFTVMSAVDVTCSLYVMCTFEASIVNRT